MARTVRVHYRALHQKRLHIPTHDISLRGIGAWAFSPAELMGLHAVHARGVVCALFRWLC